MDFVSITLAIVTAIVIGAGLYAMATGCGYDTEDDYYNLK